MKLQQEVDRVEAGVSMQENWHRLQIVRRLLRMTVWGLRQDRDREGHMGEGK